MQISNVAPAHANGASTQTARVSPAQVSAAALQRADGDGDGKTGAAALNGGDAAARAASQQVKAGRGVDIHA